PCAHDRRSARVPSRYHFTTWRASRSRSEGSTLTVNSSHHGSSRISGLYRLIRSVSDTCPAADGPPFRRAPGSRGGPSSQNPSSSASSGSPSQSAIYRTPLRSPPRPPASGGCSTELGGPHCPLASLARATPLDPHPLSS